MKQNVQFLLILLLIGQVFTESIAQNYRLSSRDRYMTAGGWVGATNYYGDLAPEIGRFSTDYRLVGMAGGVILTQKLTANIQARATIGITNIRGDDAVSANPSDELAIFRYARNLHFRNRIIESSLGMVYEFAKSEGRFWKRKEVVPYIFAGIGFLYSNPQARKPEDLGGGWVSLQPLATEGVKYAKTAFMLPFGGGVKFKASDRLDIGIEIGLRWSLTNYLDDVSGVYRNPADLSSDLAIRMADRSGELKGANGKPRDTGRLNAVFGNFVSETTPNGQPYQRLIGYGAENEIRGKSPGDMYVVTMIHAAYILNIKRYMPKFGGKTGGTKNARYNLK